MHGRSQPSAGRDLQAEFGAALAGWEWDVALLQEVPPWWPAPLSVKLGAEYQLVLTSRNSLLTVRRAIAVRRPDLIKSGGGGANAILARRDRIVAHHVHRLRRWPERRWMHAVRLACGIWIVNVHSNAGEAGALRDGRITTATALHWADGDPLVVGGDFNLRRPEFPGLRQVAARDVDHLFVADGVRAEGAYRVLDRGTLSDHPPLAVTVTWE